MFLLGYMDVQEGYMLKKIVMFLVATNVVASLSGGGDVVYNCIVLLYSAIRMRISITFSVEEMYLVLSKCV